MGLNLDKSTDTVIAVFVAAILAGALIPTALVLLYNVTFTTFIGNATVNETVQTVPLTVVIIYNVIGIAIAIAVAMLFFKMAGKM